LGNVFKLVVLFKIVYLGAIWAAIALCADIDRQTYNNVKRRWPNEGAPTLLSHFATWDVAHYVYLSQNGYSHNVPSCAFNPLWPVMIRSATYLSKGNVVIVSLVLSNVLSSFAWVVFYRLTQQRFGGRVAKYALVSLILFPGSLFYQFGYSESIFFFLLMLLWYAEETCSFRIGWFAGFLMPLARGVGVFSVFPISCYWLMRRRFWLMKNMQPLNSTISQVRPADEKVDSSPFRGVNREHTVARRAEGGVVSHSAKRKVDDGSWAERSIIVAPALGWFVYLALMELWTGNPFEGIHAQRHWNVHSIGNLWNFPKFISGYFDASNLHEFKGSVLDRAAFMMLVACFPLIWRLGKDLVVWTYALGIVPAMSGTFTSFIRYEAAIFPFFVGLGFFFGHRTCKWPFMLFVSINVVCHATLLWRFVNFRWAG
jgi:hypothetical protein